MKTALGYAETVDVYGTSTITETLTCAHCGKIYAKPKADEPVGFCHMCFKDVCLPCGTLDKCDPFEEKLRRIEQRQRLFNML
jgi:hypothetical protein